MALIDPLITFFSLISQLLRGIVSALTPARAVDPVGDESEKATLLSVDENEGESLATSWPNDLGFDAVREERTPITLPVTGNIPAYVAGTIYRNGPGANRLYDKNGKLAYEVSHWFDGFGQLHKFDLVPGGHGIQSIRYSSRFTVDTLMEDLAKTGHFAGYTFGQKRDPCMGLFRKAMCLFTPVPRESPRTTNVPVTVSANPTGFPITNLEKHAASQGHKTGRPFLVARTDESHIKAIDPETLEPIGIAKQSALHPLLKGPLSASHAKSDPETGDVFNYNLDLGKDAVYRVFKTSAATGDTEVLATIYGTGIAPAYMHSFFITENFIVLCVWSAHLMAGGLRVLWEKNVLDAIAPFDASKRTQWFVVDRRHGRGVVARFESDAAFCFHTVNAYEEPAAGPDAPTNLICDLIEYSDLDMLHRFYYSHLRSSSASAQSWLANHAPVHRFARYTLPSIPNPRSLPALSLPQRERAPPPLPATRSPVLTLTIPHTLAGELPSLNPRVIGRAYRYFWCCNFDSAATRPGIDPPPRSTFIDALTKVDTVTGAGLRWDPPAGHTPGEAIFVPDPEGEAEDDGVLLTIVLDGFGSTSYLLCLDARTMTERGRADLAGPIPFTFHGQHVPASGRKVVNV